MPQRNSIQEAIETVRQELREVEERAEKLRQALKALIELLPAPQLPLEEVAIQARPMTSRLRGVTMTKAAAMVLKEAHEPLHVNAIIERMAEGGFPVKDVKTLRMSLVGSLDRGAKQEEKGWFTKPAPATYGLREWRTDDLQVSGNGTH
jgi:hypothetical protein